ncbi:FBD domain [Arabidopsis suecica]|uniref:FBD domain n=1 Tax=Arabidopsis suecica TaxID=45249 RepID=A0A8T2DL01_ARASU|nr:FBD domain [Arabidopsis suecica]
MDIFNGLPDDVLVKILSFVPTKVAVSTSILSKRWEFLWMWLPRLDFGSPKTDLLAFLNTCQYDKEEEVGLVDFIDKKLPLHRAPFLAMYVCWKFLMNVGMKTYFRTLQLDSVTFVEGKSLQDILSICPVLDDLSVICSVHQDVKEFTIIVPSLQSLTLFIENCEVFDGYVIDTPLKYLKLEDVHEEEHYCLLKKMPKLREAYVDVQLDDLKSLIGSITSVKRLNHMFREKSKILGQLLKDSPNLRVLNIFKVQGHVTLSTGVDCWNQPISVPECLLESLQIFNLSHYFGNQQDRDFVVYILKNACHLKTATILADEPEHLVPNLKELTLSPRASSTCQLSIRCGLGSERS